MQECNIIIFTIIDILVKCLGYTELQKTKPEHVFIEIIKQRIKVTRVMGNIMK